MDNKRKKPKLRFREFSNDWELRKLSDILKRRQINQLISEDAPRLAFAAGQGVIPLSERKTNNRDQLIADEATKKYLLTELDDIVYNPANLKYGAIDRNKYGRGVISPIYVTFVTTEVPSFIERIVTTENFKNKALQYEEGTVIKRQSVSPENLLSFSEMISPSHEEQKKIGDFFDNIDAIININKNKVDLLIQQKKGITQKLFSQKIRFKRDDGTEYPKWDEMKLRELTHQVSIKSSDNNLPVYSVSNQKGFIPQSEQFEDREVASQNKTNYHVVSHNQFAYNPSRINVGSIAYLKENTKVIVSPLYVVFECLKPLNVAFLDCFVRTSMFDIQRKVNMAGSVRDNLSYEGFSEITINLPCLEEQQRIVDFLFAYDEAICYAKQELEKWKELKKGLLQQMFV